MDFSVNTRYQHKNVHMKNSSYLTNLEKILSFQLSVSKFFPRKKGNKWNPIGLWFQIKFEAKHRTITNTGQPWNIGRLPYKSCY